MFLQLAHTKLEVYIVSRKLVIEVYKLTKQFPDTEKFGLVSQMRRAALSTHLNTAEGSSRKSIADRKRFYEIARSSVVELDSATGVAYELSYKTLDELETLGALIVQTFKLVCGMINNIEGSKL